MSGRSGARPKRRGRSGVEGRSGPGYASEEDLS
jgi:hypothetical protein